MVVAEVSIVHKFCCCQHIAAQFHQQKIKNVCKLFLFFYFQWQGTWHRQKTHSHNTLNTWIEEIKVIHPCTISDFPWIALHCIRWSISITSLFLSKQLELDRIPMWNRWTAKQSCSVSRHNVTTSVEWGQSGIFSWIVFNQLSVVCPHTRSWGKLKVEVYLIICMAIEYEILWLIIWGTMDICLVNK